MDLSVYLNALTAFFVIIDPIGAALIFHSLVPVDQKQFRVKMAVKSAVIALILLVVFGNYGESLLTKLGISIHALKISGGLLLFFTAFNMVTRDIEAGSVSTTKKDISVFPMSIPLLAGPGSLTLSILLFSTSTGSFDYYSVLLATISIIFLTMILMLLSGYVKRVIGRTGDEILRRFLGVILAALAIQFIFDGMSGISL